MGNHKKVEAEIKAVMGENTKVVHKFAMPTTVVSIVDGKKGSRECLPLYYLNCYRCGINPCGGHRKTAEFAQKLEGVAPAAEAIDRND